MLVRVRAGTGQGWGPQAQVRVGKRDRRGAVRQGNGLQGPTGGASRAGRGRTCAAGAEEETAGGRRGRDPAPRQLRAPPRELTPRCLGPPAAARCAAQRAGAESPPQLQGRRGRVTPPPPRGRRLPGPTGRMEPQRAPAREVSVAPPEP